MEISEVRRRIHEAMAKARQHAADRRARADRASASFGAFLEHTAVPLVRQIANVLKAEGYRFSVFTPPGSVRLMSERSAQDYIEVSLDTAGEAPRVIGHISRSWGRQVSEADRVIAPGEPSSVSEEDLLAFLMKELEPFIEK